MTIDRVGGSPARSIFHGGKTMTLDERKKELATRCRNLRQSLNLSQNDVARDLNYTRQSINNFEKGKTWSYVILTWYLDRGLKL